MKILKIILLLILMNLFVRCEPKEEECYDCYPIFEIISPVLIECSYLDTIFSELNHYSLNDNLISIPSSSINVEYTNYTVINSKEELDKINSFNFDFDCIDFSEYTLIGGIILGSSLNNFAISLYYPAQWITGYGLSMKVYGNKIVQQKNFYWWRLFPKLDENLKIITFH